MFFRFDNLKMEYVRVDLRPLVILPLLFICLIVFMSTRSDKTKVSTRYVSSEMIVNIKGVEFSQSNLKRYIKMCGIKFPDIVYAQAVLESGSFKSRRFLESNNLFGMKVARSRPTTASREHGGHSYYDSWMFSVQDYALFQSAFLRDIKTEHGYMLYLSKNYAEDPNYVTKLKTIINEGNNSR